MKKRNLINKLALTCAFVLFCVSVFSAMPATALTTEDLTLGGLVPEKTIEEMGHMQISDNLADELNGVEYINEDGTRTAYLFAEPIKYEDENNQIKQIDKSLRKAVLKNGWKNAANRFSFFVHNDIQDGVELSYDDVSLKATPILSALTETGKRSNTSRISANKVGRSDSTTEISYESTYTGYTANVTVPVGNGSLFAMDLSGDISFVTTENGQVTVSMKDGSSVTYATQAFMVDEEIMWIDDLEIEVQAQKDCKRVAFSINAETFKETDIVTLAIGGKVKTTHENTTRSTVSPTPISTHADAEVVSTSANQNYGNSLYNRVGPAGTIKYYRSFIRMNVSPLSHIQYYQVVSAKYNTCSMGFSGRKIQVDAYMVTGGWTETGITWANMPTYDSEKIATINVLGGHNGPLYEIYITRAVMGWMQGITNNGIMLKARLEENVGTYAFASRDNGNYVPSLNVTYTTDTTSMDNIGIEDGEEYYIKNKNSMKYLTASGNTSTSNVIQSDWSGAANQKWTVTYDGEGYYKLSPANASNLVLDTSGGNNTNGANIQLYSPNTGLGQKFKFVRNWDGSYQIVTRLSGDIRGLRAENSSASSGSNVHHYTHAIDWTKDDDWTLEKVGKGFADVFCFSEFDTDEETDNMVASLEAMEYYAYKYKDASAQTAYTLMSSDDIFIYCGHGGTGFISFTNGDAISAGNPDYWPITEKPHNDFAGMKLAIYGACSTGADDIIGDPPCTYNLVGITYQKGAHFVIGRPEPVASPHDEVWIKQFLARCLAGDTIYQAMCAADDYIYNIYDDPGVDFGNANQYHVLGDYSLRLDR